MLFQLCLEGWCQHLFEMEALHNPFPIAISWCRHLAVTGSPDQPGKAMGTALPSFVGTALVPHSSDSREATWSTLSKAHPANDRDFASSRMDSEDFSVQV